MKRFIPKGQSAIEYMLLFAVVITVVVVAVGPNSILTRKTNETLMRSANAIRNMAESICFDEDAADWSVGDWSPCVIPSGCEGTQTRSVSCPTSCCPSIKPSVTQACYINSVDGSWGNWGSWSAWSACSNCSSKSTRSRNCDSPAPTCGGAMCPGDATETLTRVCGNIDGGWGDWTSWSAWSACSSCNKTRTRTRQCDNPARECGGANCPGPFTETLNAPCIVDGGWSAWVDSGNCSLTCGGGFKPQTRSCTNPAPDCGGAWCVGSETQSVNCNTQCCPRDGGWTDWSPWSECSVSCGGGTQIKVRSCTNPTVFCNGNPCTGDSTATQDCNTDCCPVDGGWSDWSVCSNSCGDGTQTRTCTNPTPDCGGLDCPTTDPTTQPCNIGCCVVDGGWSVWSAWSACSTTCGPGSKYQTRTCDNPPHSCGGLDCPGGPGAAMTTQSCNLGCCLVPGGWTSWTDISETSCSSNCFKDVTQQRYCTNPPPLCGGSCSGSDTQTVSVSCSVSGYWSAWSAWSGWSACSGCYSGNSRDRTCIYPSTTCVSADCVGSRVEVLQQFCGLVDAGWSQWYDLTGCNVACGTGTYEQIRYCNDPPYACGGNPVCPNDGYGNQRTLSCDMGCCPVPGGWSDWTAISACNASCDEEGTYTARRYCDSPPPSCGGTCDGLLQQDQDLPCSGKSCCNGCRCTTCTD